MNSRDVVTSLDPVNLVRIEKHNLPLYFDANALGLSVTTRNVVEQRLELSSHRRMIVCRQPLLRSLQRLTESQLINWFQQIIERADLERIHGVIIECGD